ncbi:YqaA family protein [Chloroflexota bacterium]
MGNVVMSSLNNNSEQTGVGKGERLKKKVIPLLTILLVVAITAALFFYRDRVAELGNYGYLGAFLISLVSNATIILPMPGFLILFALGATFNPFLVGLAGAAGGTIGEMTCYMLGYSGRGVVQNRRLYDKLVQWLKKWGVLTVFIFAATPLPFDVMGMVAGLLRFPFWKFFLACWFGKAVKYIGIALAGALGWEVALRYFG